METNKLVLEVPRLISITRSFSRKVNPANYGITGHNFESADFFASYGDQVPADSTQEQMQRLSNELYILAKTDVDNAAEEHIRNLKGDIPSVISSKEIREIAPIIQEIIDGKILPGSVIKTDTMLTTAQTKFLDRLLNG